MWLSQRFNETNKAWALERRAMQRKMRGMGLTVPKDTDINYQTGRWRQKGAHYLRAVPERQRVALPGGSSVELTSTGWEELLDATVGPVVEAMDKEMSAAAYQVWEGAPVRSGLYRSRWAIRWRVDGDKLIAALENDTPYAKLNKKGNGKGRLANQSLATRLTRDAAIKVGFDALARIQAGGG